MNSPCVNCGADTRVCKECDWYNGVWVSKDQYEARLKTDLKAILVELQLEIEEIKPLEPQGDWEDWQYGCLHGLELMQDKCLRIIQQKIDKLKEQNT